MEALLLILSILFVLLFGGFWVFGALGIAGLLGIILFGANWQFASAIQMWGTTNSFTLTAVPLFILLGEIMLRSGISASLYRGVMSWVGRVPGGLLHSNVIACAVFAAISGSSVATAATIGRVAIPEQEARQYDRGLILGSIAASGTLGILIPPSISMIIYGAWMEVSIARLFIGGVVPGVMLSLLFIGYIGVRTALNPALAPATSSSWRERAHSIIDVGPSLTIVLFIILAIYTGLMTPTETAAVASAFAFVVTAVLGKFSFKLVYDCAFSAVCTTVKLMLIVVGAQIFVMFLVYSGVASLMTSLLVGYDLSPLMVLVFIYVVYLILGCFFDAISLLMVTLPFAAPIVNTLGIDPIWFGVVITVLLGVGHITPPIGMNLYVLLGITEDCTLQEIVKSVIPFFLLLLLGVVLMNVFPELVLWLPRTMLDVAN